MVAVTDNIVLTACEDGAVRAVHLYPHRFVGTVGHHRGGFGVERLDVNGTGETVASVSHDHRVKFWNIQYLEVGGFSKTICRHRCLENCKKNPRSCITPCYFFEKFDLNGIFTLLPYMHHACTGKKRVQTQ